MFGPVYLVDKATYFKPYNLSFLPALAQIYNNILNRQYYNQNRSLQVTTFDLITEWEKDYSSPNSIIWGIFSPDGKFQGKIGLYLNKQGQIYYSILVDQQFQRQGIQNRSLAYIIIHVVKKLNCPAIYSMIRPNNQVSMRNVQKVGFTQINFSQKTFISPVDGISYDDAKLVWINPFWVKERNHQPIADDLKTVLNIRPEALEIAEEFIAKSHKRVVTQ